jgi:hypothetical protein
VTTYALFGKVLSALDEMMRVMPASTFFAAEQKLALLKKLAPD